MNWLTPPLDFDRTRPYWGLVTAYLAQVHGFIELASRGLITQIKDVSLEDLRRQATDQKGRETLDRLAPRTKTALLGQPTLASQTEKSITVDIEALAAVVCDDHPQVLAHFNTQSAGALLVVAWEMSKEGIKQGPVREFFRHCRNAAAHGGRFHFENREPRRASEWRGKTVERALEGSRLFTVPTDRGFIEVGDVLYLLYDVEKGHLMASSGAADA